jgi:uncharacterized repeat protein (TIGR01451 family)
VRAIDTKKVAIRGAIVIAMIATSMTGSAGAVTATATGNIVKLASAPASVAHNQAESATSAFAFDERQAVVLTEPLIVDHVVPGPLTDGFLVGKIPAGTVVNSHMVHNDPVQGTHKPRRLGDVTYDGEIVGVVARTGKLVTSDFLGAPGTTYGGTRNDRGFEGSVDTPGHRLSDRYSISADRRTISLDFKTWTLDDIRVLTSPGDSLQTTIADAPDPVTAGNDVQYTLKVKNASGASIADVHVVDTLPAGATLKFAPPSCAVTTVVDCPLGTLAAGAEAEVKIVVTSPGAAGSMTNTATATPGSNSVASETTTIEPVTAGVSKGWVMPDESLSTTGHDPANVMLPGGNGAPVIINQSYTNGSFCSGPCAAPMTTVDAMPDYSNPASPVRLRLTWNFAPGDLQSMPDALTAAAIAFGKPLYVQDSGNPAVGAVVPPCSTVGVASPDPCYDSHTITQPASGNFAVSFDVRYTGGAITVARG